MKIEQTFWSAGLRLEGNGVSVHEVAEVRGLLARHGTVLLRGFRDAVEAFDEFTRGIGVVRPANIRTATSRRPAADGTLAVSDDGYSIALHAESYYTPICPHVLAFACVESTVSAGGQTLLCDGVRLYRGLPEETRTMLARCRIVWTHDCSVASIEEQTRLPLTVLLSMCARVDRCEVTHDEDQVHFRYTPPVIRRTMWNDEDAFANNLLNCLPTDLARVAPGLPLATLQAVGKAAQGMTFAHAWQTGDLLLIDNTRFMHGRTGWSGGRRTILQRMLRLD